MTPHEILLDIDQILCELEHPNSVDEQTIFSPSLIGLLMLQGARGWEPVQAEIVSLSIDLILLSRMAIENEDVRKLLHYDTRWQAAKARVILIQEYCGSTDWARDLFDLPFLPTAQPAVCTA